MSFRSPLWHTRLMCYKDVLLLSQPWLGVCLCFPSPDNVIIAYQYIIAIGLCCKFLKTCYLFFTKEKQYFFTIKQLNKRLIVATLVC